MFIEVFTQNVNTDMKDNFAVCLAKILHYEGGYTTSLHDGSLATNYGITLGTYRAYGRPDATADDLHMISMAEVSEIYRVEYWDVVAADSLPIGLDLAVFDTAVNMGPGTAARMLQDVLGVIVDGAIGPATLSAIHKLEPSTVINRYTMAREQRYRTLPEFPEYGNGWLNRCEDCRKTGLSMALHGEQTIGASIPTPAAHPVQQAPEAHNPGIVVSMLDRVFGRANPT